jgi:D-lactate dehydrogenase
MELVIVDSTADDVLFFSHHLPDVLVIGQRGGLDVDRLREPHRVEALVVTVPVNEDHMRALPNLRLITTRSTGYDHIDVAAAERRGITVCNAPAVGPSVAEHAFALLLAAARRLPHALESRTRGTTLPSELMGFELHGKILGVVGAGRIGRQCIQIGRGFGMRALAFDAHPDPVADFPYVGLEELLETADVVLLACPLTPNTRRFISAPEFAQMKPGAILVNVARGEVLDTGALLGALEGGRLGAAALDVLEGEELPTDLSSFTPDPTKAITSARNAAVRRHPRAVVTPHVGFYTKEAWERVRHVTLGNVRAFFAGHPQHVVADGRAVLAP